MRRRGSAAAAAPGVNRDAHAGLDWSGALVARRMPFVPAEFRRALRQVSAPHCIGGQRREVLDSKLHRIHIDEVSQLIHHDLGVEGTLRMAWSSHGPLLASIREYVLVASAAVRNLINIRQWEIGGGAGPARTPRLGFERGDNTVRR